MWDRLRTPVGSDHDRYHNQTFTCVNVVDGDTLDIGVPDADRITTRIRLWGVDTPESEVSPRGAMHFGAEASAFTKSQVLFQPVRVVLAPDRARDKYDRLLAYVYYRGNGRDERMLNEELIAGGYGYADSRFDHVWKQRFRDLEAAARKDQLGLWKDVTPARMPEWRQRYEEWRSEGAN